MAQPPPLLRDGLGNVVTKYANNVAKIKRVLNVTDVNRVFPSGAKWASSDPIDSEVIKAVRKLCKVCPDLLLLQSLLDYAKKQRKESLKGKGKKAMMPKRLQDERIIVEDCSVAFEKARQMQRGAAIPANAEDEEDEHDSLFDEKIGNKGNGESAGDADDSHDAVALKREQDECDSLFDEPIGTEQDGETTRGVDDARPPGRVRKSRVSAAAAAASEPWQPILQHLADAHGSYVNGLSLATTLSVGELQNTADPAAPIAQIEQLEARLARENRQGLGEMARLLSHHGLMPFETALGEE